MPEPETPSRRSLFTTTLAFAIAIAAGWLVIYLVYRYLATGWKM